MKSPKNRELTIDLNLITQRSDAANFGERGYPPPQQAGKEKRKSKPNKNRAGMQRPSYAVSHPVTPQYASYGNGSFVCTTPSLSLPPTPSFLSFYPGAAPIPAPLPSPTYYGHPWQHEAANNPPFLGAEWPSPHYDQTVFVHHNRPWNESRYSGYPAAPYMVSPQRKMPEMREPPRKYKPPTSRAPPKPKQTNSYIAAVSCRVHNVVKRVRGFCLKAQIPLVKVVDGPNVLKISVRSTLHTQKVEKVLSNLIHIDKVNITAISLPESIDITKRKRGFLLFVKLEDFEQDEARVRSRFAETGLDYKIKLVNNTDEPSPAANKTEEQSGEAGSTDVDKLIKQVEGLQLEVQDIKKSYDVQ